MDYYGFPPQLYQLKFTSRGDAKLSKRIVDLYREASRIQHPGEFLLNTVVHSMDMLPGPRPG